MHRMHMTIIHAYHIPLASALMALLQTQCGLPLLFVLALVLIACCAVTLRPVPDPYRAVIYRLATLHRVSGPGYVFILPWLDSVHDHLLMGEREEAVVVRNAPTADGHLLTLRLEATWRISPHVHGRPTEPIRSLLLLPEERRAKLIDEAVSRAVSHTLVQYRLGDVMHPAARESIITTAIFLANDELAPRGLVLDRIFWRS